MSYRIKNGFKNPPPRAVVVEIVNAEAAAARVGARDVFGNGRLPHVLAVRWRCWERILAETGCSQNGLAYVWGCDRKSIWNAMRKPERQEAQAA